MKTKILLSLILLFGFANAQDAKLKLEYDEFSNITSFTLSDIKVKDEDGNKAELYFFIANEGDSLATPKIISMGFSQTSNNWQYLNCTTMNFLLDTTRVELGESEHTGSIIGTKVLEQLYYEQSFSFLEKLVLAKIVRFKLCGYIFAIESKYLNHLKFFNTKILEKLKAQ